MVWKLLKKNISVGQIAGYSLASLIGLSIVLCAVKFYSDVSSAFNDDDSFISKDYLIISKQVTAAGTLGFGGQTTFSKAEIDEIKAQPWVRDMGEFTAADFNVQASVDLAGRGMSTILFFEAIPDNFFDLKSDEWSFEAPASSGNSVEDELKGIEIPIVLSKDYLALYNFGFATGRGMPQLNENLVKNVPLTFTLSGNGHHDTFRGRVAGFSSRLNTIAVPLDFMEWANRRYSSHSKDNPSRLIIEANTPGDPAINSFLEKNSYEVAGDKADNSKANYFLNVITSIVIAVGAIITVLAFFILMLSIYLLLQKNKEKLHNLMLLGYSPGQVARSYYILIASINVAVLLLAIAVMVVSSPVWTEKLAAIGISSATYLSAVLVGVAITALVTFLNCFAVKCVVRKNFFNT